MLKSSPDLHPGHPFKPAAIRTLSGGGRLGSPLHVFPNFNGTLFHDLNPHLLVTVTIVLSPTEGVYLSFTNGMLNGLTVTGEQVVNNPSNVDPENVTVIDFDGPEARSDSYALSLWRSIYIPSEIARTRLNVRVKKPEAA